MKIILLFFIIFLISCAPILQKNKTDIQFIGYCKIEPSTGCCTDEILGCSRSLKTCTCIDRHQAMGRLGDFNK